MNTKQFYSRKSEAKRKILKANPDITDDSGIYKYERVVHYVYIGQARNILQRLISHDMSYEQRLDISLKKHGYYDILNPQGWRVSVLERCDLERLDQAERYWIERHKIDPTTELLNVTGGGQTDKATDIGQRKPSKGYRDGVKYGHDKTIKDILERLNKGNIGFYFKNDCPSKNQIKHLEKLEDMLNAVNNAE